MAPPNGGAQRGSGGRPVRREKMRAGGGLGGRRDCFGAASGIICLGGECGTRRRSEAARVRPAKPRGRAGPRPAAPAPHAQALAARSTASTEDPGEQARSQVGAATASTGASRPGEKKATRRASVPPTPRQSVSACRRGAAPLSAAKPPRSPGRGRVTEDESVGGVDESGWESKTEIGADEEVRTRLPAMKISLDRSARVARARSSGCARFGRQGMTGALPQPSRTAPRSPGAAPPRARCWRSGPRAW